MKSDRTTHRQFIVFLLIQQHASKTAHSSNSRLDSNMHDSNMYGGNMYASNIHMGSCWCFWLMHLLLDYLLHLPCHIALPHKCVQI